MKARWVNIRIDSPGGRLDRIVAVHLDELSRTQLQRLIHEGKVRVDNRVVYKPSFPLEGGEEVQVEIPPPKPSHLIPEQIPLDIIFENEDMLAINKPAGMVVHPSAGHEQGTLVHAVLGHRPEMHGIGGEIRPGVVHRLDKGTSGVILMAKNDVAHRTLQAQFKNRTVEKTYWGLVDEKPPSPNGRIEVPIGRDPRHRRKMAAVPLSQGRKARTDYRTLESFPGHTLLELHPLTGRTHQIRVHLAFLECPIVGDRVYGRRKPSLRLGRPFLHAAGLSILLPGEREPRKFSAPLPDDLEALLSGLRGELRE